MQEIMFSVAVITYNQEKYISQTLDSILNQEHDYKYEIVIGEDCSTDNTKKIIEEYVTKYPDIIKPLYNNPNKGLINNYFNVIAHCQGKYIMECAGDDYWLPGKVKLQIEFMENNPTVGMCYGKAKVYNENKQKYEKSIIGDFRKNFEEMITNENAIPALCVCFKNSLIKKYINEIQPEKKDWLMEDYPMWLYFSNETKIQFIDKIIAVYRMLENSASHFTNFNKQLNFEKSVLQIRSFYNNKYQLNYEWEIDKEYFKMYRKFLLKKYDKNTAKKYRDYYEKIKVKSITNFVIYIFSKSRGLLNILIIFNKIRKIPKKLVNIIFDFL